MGSSFFSCTRETNHTSSNADDDDDDDDEIVSCSWIRSNIHLTYFGDDDGSDGIRR